MCLYLSLYISFLLFGHLFLFLIFFCCQTEKALLYRKHAICMHWKFWDFPRVPGKIKFCAKKFPNFLPATLAIYRIVNIWNDQQMSLISHFRSFNSSFQKCRLKIANREWKMFLGELSAAANKYWCVFSGRIIYTEKE